MKIAGPEHPITTEPNPSRVSVTAGGRIIADTTRAICLREATYPPVFYIPRADVDMTALARTAHSSHCPYKGDAAYYSIVMGETRVENAAWTYEAPYEAVAAIKDHLAFYPDCVDRIETQPA